MYRCSIILFLLLLASCDKTEVESITNSTAITWHLIQVGISEGGGDTIPIDVESEKQLTFYENGTFKSNSDFCAFMADAGVSSSGIYEASNSILYAENCLDNGIKKLFYYIEENKMTIYYPCICGCFEVYEQCKE